MKKQGWKRLLAGSRFFAQIRIDKIFIRYKGKEGCTDGLAQPGFLLLAAAFGRRGMAGDVPR
ncbi:hypothetical protein ABE38_00280 [Brevibacillus agri]|nr:hypothetical protein [Brevibacillus agri]